MLKNKIVTRWGQPGGYRELLQIAVPLVLSAGFWSIQTFVDRMFLTWHSREALAAVVPAGMLSYTFAGLFVGTAAYVNTFVAQYSGAERPERVGPAIWQGLYFCILAGLFMLALIPFAEQIFAWARHDPAVSALETTYFQILCVAAGPNVAAVTAACFFMGRGDTRTVMCVDLAASALNAVLDYAWIFGHWGFPEWGIRGAGWATVVANVFGLAVFLVLLLRPKFRKAYHTLSGWRPDPALFRRLMRFGIPSGIECALGTLGLSLFTLIVGRLGTDPLAATGLVTNLAWVAFLPMMGFTVGISTLVGRFMGRERPDLAERCVWSAFRLVMGYVAVWILCYLLLSDLILAPFATGADPDTFGPVRDISLVLLWFLAAGSPFDFASLVFVSGIKGAGDTRFVMVVLTSLNWIVMVIPAYLSCAVYDWGLYVAWAFKLAFIVLAGTVFCLRFLGGKWKAMRVIEEQPEMDGSF